MILGAATELAAIASGEDEIARAASRMSLS
jgi:hypothetical protein